MTLDQTLFTFGETAVSARALIESTAIILLTALLSRITVKTVVRLFQRNNFKDTVDIQIYTRICNVFIWIPGILTALTFLGFNLTMAFATGGFFAVGMGFLLKSVISNYMCGVSLKIDRTIRPGDVVEFDGVLVKILETKFRTTRTLTRDDSVLMIPNVTLFHATINNLTQHDDKDYRIGIDVGVAYSSDMKQVRDVLEKTAAALDWRVQKTEPLIVLDGYGESSVIFKVYVWIDDPWWRLERKSQLHEAVWQGLQDAGIVIAFPQLDLHIKDAVAAKPTADV